MFSRPLALLFLTGKNTKKDVKPLATAGRTKKKDGDSKND